MEENTQKYFKYCLVPLCKSTSVKTPNKIFIRLPFDRKRRTTWLKACRRYIHDISPKSNALHVCEDHFNLEEDMENYMRFKLMGGFKKIKPGVVPHIFNCQPDRVLAQPARVTALKKVKRQLVQEAAASTSTSTQPLQEQNLSSVEANNFTDKPAYEDDIQKKDVSTQTSKQFFCKLKSKRVQCKLYRGVSVGLSAPRVLYEHIGTSPGLKETPIRKELDGESSPSRYTRHKTERYSEYHEEQDISESYSLSGSEKLQEKLNNEFAND